MKRIWITVLALVLVCSFGVTAYAHDVPDPEREGSIEIIVKYNGKPVSGGTLKCCQVGAIFEEDGNYSFVRVLDGAPLEDVDSPELAEELAEYAVDNGIRGKSVTVEEDGMAVFENLTPGLYVIVQTKAASGFGKLNPFLVSLPYMEDGEYRYDVTAAVKSELEQEPESTPATTEKDWQLPQTGQLKWPVPLLVVLGTGFFAVGWYLRFGRKKDGYAE